jgi:hypothetical protein
LFQHFEENIVIEEILLQVKSAMLLCTVALPEIFNFYFTNLKKNVWINDRFCFENLELTIDVNFSPEDETEQLRLSLVTMRTDSVKFIVTMD